MYLTSVYYYCIAVAVTHVERLATNGEENISRLPTICRREYMKRCYDKIAKLVRAPNDYPQTKKSFKIMRL